MTTERIRLAAESALLGVVVALLALPVVTLAPALAAGCDVMRSWRDGAEPPLLATLLGRTRRHLAGGLPASLAALALAGVVAADLVLVRAGLPGGAVAGAAILAMAAIAAGVLLAVVAQAGAAGWSEAWRQAARLRPAALLGLGGVVATATGVVWLVPVVAPFLVGPVLLGAVALTHDTGRRTA